MQLDTVFIEVQIAVGLQYHHHHHHRRRRHHRHRHHHHHHHHIVNFVGLCRKDLLLFIPLWFHRRLLGLPQLPRLIGQLRIADFVSLSQCFAARVSRSLVVLQNFATSGGVYTYTF